MQRRPKPTTRRARGRGPLGQRALARRVRHFDLCSPFDFDFMILYFLAACRAVVFDIGYFAISSATTSAILDSFRSRHASANPFDSFRGWSPPVSSRQSKMNRRETQTGVTTPFWSTPSGYKATPPRAGTIWRKTSFGRADLAAARKSRRAPPPNSRT
jgi:hypothetical protein